jgi:prophage regulatory protein
MSADLGAASSRQASVRFQGRAAVDLGNAPGSIRRFLTFPELKRRCGIPYSRMHIDRLEKRGQFPKRVHLGPNSVGWIEDEVAAWQAERIGAREQTALPEPASCDQGLDKMAR